MLINYFIIAEVFALISLILLVLYGLDIIFKNFNSSGFVQFDTITKQVIFLTIIIIFSILTFFISLKRISTFSSSLIISGIVMMVGLTSLFDIIDGSGNVFLVLLLGVMLCLIWGIFTTRGLKETTA